LLTVGVALPVVVVVLLFGLGVAGGAQATPAPSAVQLLHTALADAAARGSFHEVVSDVSGKQAMTFSDDVATSEGRQEIRKSSGEQAHVLVVAGVAYFSGNQAALVRYFGLSNTVARGVGTRWVSVSPPSHGYAVVAAGATLGSALEELTPPGPLVETAPTRLNGESVVGIRGTLPAADGKGASEIIYISRTSRPLPVLVIASRKASGTTPAASSTIKLTAWGEHLALEPPTNAIPSSKL
jgi:hypothetical protein